MTYTGKSTQITDLDSTPATKSAGGAGAAGFLQEVSGTVTCTTSDASGSTYAFVRLRSDCYVKNVILNSAALGSGTTIDLGVYYSDNTLDFPTNPALPGTVIKDNLFANNLSVSSAVTDTDETNQSGNYTLDLRLEPLWQAAGLTSDPGGYFDIVATTDSGITTGGLFGVSVRFVTV